MHNEHFKKYKNKYSWLTSSLNAVLNWANEIAVLEDTHTSYWQ